jgi:exodeoxyribonuclease V gamma subunit
VWFELEEATIEDSEPFELDGLQHYQLKALLLDAHLTEGESEARRHRLQLSGLLPQGWFGSLLLEEIDGEMGKLAARLRPWTGDKQAVEIDIALAQGQLQGWIDTQKGRALVVKPGSFNGKDLLLAWIQHLCLSLSSAPATPCCSMPNRVCGCQGLRRTRRGPGWRPWWPSGPRG